MPVVVYAFKRLRRELLAIDPAGPNGFEGLVADCLAAMTGLVFRLAKSGSQFGRDATSSPAPFAIAMEAKRYSKSPTLEELAGKAVLAANFQGDTIDLWILGCTSEIGDDTVGKLAAILEEQGVTLLTLDWAGRPLPPLAVLLAATKDTTIAWFKRCAARVDRQLLSRELDAVASDPAFAAQVQHVRDVSEAANVGLDALRRRSGEWLRARLTDRAASQISFGQFVSVSQPLSPAQPRTLLGRTVALAIESVRTEGVVAVLGDEGVGKTWLIAQWWAALPNPPIMLLVAGRRVERLVPENAMESFARLLAEQDGSLDERSLHGWRKRLDRWQGFDSNGQIRFVVVLDGLNERSNYPWADIIKSHRLALAALGGVLVVTSREAFWKRDIASRLPGPYPLASVSVTGYSDEELAAVLAPAKVSPSDLAPKVREFLRNPRVCSVAVKLVDRLQLQPSELTIERLLLEYWQARLEERGNLIAHNVADFNKLLQAHARAYREQPKRVFERDDWTRFSGAVKRRGFEGVQNDLTEIEEGRFLQVDVDNPNLYEFRNEALPFALGLLVNDELRAAFRDGDGQRPVYLDEQLSQILDPVRGFDAIADVVAAALGLACLEHGFPDEGREALIRASCGLQNVRETAVDAMAAYVSACPSPFLNVAESPPELFGHVNHPEFLTSVLEMSRDRPALASALKERLPRWLSRWSKHTYVISGDSAFQQRRAEERDVRIRQNIEDLSSSELDFFRHLTVYAEELGALQLDRLAAVLLAGRPLALYAEGIVGWALVQAVANDFHSAGEEIAWIVRLNSVDGEETSEKLRKLIGGVTETSSRPIRAAAATVLRLLGDARSASRAELLRPRTPGHRWRRVELFCDTNPHDPAASPGSNLDNARSALAALDPSLIWNHMGQTADDMNLETVMPALARFDEAPLIKTLRDVIATAPLRTAMQLRQLAWGLSELSPLLDSTRLEAVRKARRLLQEDPTRINEQDLLWVSSNLASAELPHLSAEEQLDLILRLPEKIPMFTHMRRGLKPLSSAKFEERIADAEKRADGGEALKRVLFFAGGSPPELTDGSRASIIRALGSENQDVSILAAELVYRAADRDLDVAFLDRASSAPWAFASDENSVYHGRAVVAAVTRTHRSNALDLVHPRFLTAVADQLDAHGLDHFADLTERALDRVLNPIDAELRVVMDPYMGASADGLEVRTWAEERTQPSDEPDLEALKELADLEGGARRFAERHQVMREAMAAYEKELVGHGALGVTAPPQVGGLKPVVANDPTKARRWVERIVATTDPRLLSQVRNIGFAICGAYASHDGALAAAGFGRLRDAGSIWNIRVDGVELYESALFAAGRVPQLDALKESVFLDSFNDQELECAVHAAESCQSVEWLTEFVEAAIRRSGVGNRARALTIAGFRAKNPSSDRLLSREWGLGFLEEVAAFSRKNYERDEWARHWMEEAVNARNPIDLWRFGKLAEGVVDRRFALWPREPEPSDLWVRFGQEVIERLGKAAEKRSKDRAQSLFGLKAPDRDLVRVLRDDVQ